VADLIRAEITGLGDTLRHLDGLRRSIQTKVLKDALGAGAKLVLESERSAAPHSTDPRLIPGLLEISLGVKVKVYRNDGAVVILVGPRTKMGQDKKTTARKLTAFGRRAEKLQAKQKRKLGSKQVPTQYAHLAGPGRKQKFMDRAKSVTASQVKELVISKIWDGIVKAMNT
jgi:hypothetical protein